MKKKILILITTVLISATSLFGQGIWSVDDCMRYAIDNNPQSRKQQLIEDDARKSQTEATLAFLPSFDARTSLGGNFGRSIDPETNSYVSTSTLSNSYGAEAYIDLFNGLKVFNGLRIARAAKLREELTSTQVNDQIATRTMTAYYKAIFAYGTLSISKNELSDSRKNYEKKKVEYEIGLANISELAQLESSVSQGEYNVINFDGLYKKSLIELKNEMYFPFDEEIAIDTVGNTPLSFGAAIEDIGSIVNSAMTFLPDLKIYAANEKIAKFEFGKAKAGLFPKLSIAGGISTGYSRYLGEFGEDQPSYQKQLTDRFGQYASLNLSIPLFRGLSAQKDIQRKKNAYKRARIDAEQKEREIERMVIEAVIDLESYEKQCNQSIINVKANTLSYKTTDIKFNEGLSSVIDLQATQTNLSRAKVEQLKAFLNYLMQRRIVDYYKGVPLLR